MWREETHAQYFSALGRSGGLAEVGRDGVYYSPSVGCAQDPEADLSPVTGKVLDGRAVMNPRPLSLKIAMDPH